MACHSVLHGESPRPIALSRRKPWTVTVGLRVYFCRKHRRSQSRHRRSSGHKGERHRSRPYERSSRHHHHHSSSSHTAKAPDTYRKGQESRSERKRGSPRHHHSGSRKAASPLLTKQQAGSLSRPDDRQHDDRQHDDKYNDKYDDKRHDDKWHDDKYDEKRHDDKHDDRQYGEKLLPGEGTAMASYVQAGIRIPRRGEIGIDMDKIERFEKEGYVMSGNRHAAMNAVRMRKETQVIETEERKKLLLLSMEERQKREEEIIRGFKSLIAERKFKGL